MEGAGPVPVLVGGLLGWAAGLGAWLVARWAVARYRRGTDPEPPARAVGGLRQNGRLTSLPALLAQAGCGAWGVYLGWRAASAELCAAALVLTGLLLCISLVDFQVRLIPNPLLAALLAWGVAQVLWLRQPGIGSAALGLLAGGGIFFLLAALQRGAMGAGDVKLAAVLGAVVGFPAILPALLAGALAGGAAALWLLATRRAGRKDPMAYGPYLALGAWLVWTRGAGLWG